MGGMHGALWAGESGGLGDTAEPHVKVLDVALFPGWRATQHYQHFFFFPGSRKEPGCARLIKLAHAYRRNRSNELSISI